MAHLCTPMTNCMLNVNPGCESVEKRSPVIRGDSQRLRYCVLGKAAARARFDPPADGMSCHRRGLWESGGRGGGVGGVACIAMWSCAL
jgi:hypothetical protein